ncbi:MAG TPA: PAS domain S-box protein [Planctomycetaceae bacterium]|nr:PAS domain S-box protein [Planctomycetaceae bacterium]
MTLGEDGPLGSSSNSRFQNAPQRSDDALQQATEVLTQKTVALAESQAVIRAMLEATDNAIVVMDANGHVVAFNQRFIEMWNLSLTADHRLDSDSLPQVMARQLEDSSAFLAAIKQTTLPAPHQAEELRLADGRIIEQVSAVQSVDGVVRGSVWSYRDVTERQRAESLRNHLSAVVESSDDAIITKTLNSIITTWNPAAERIFGYRAEEAIGRSIVMLIPPARTQEEEYILNRLKRRERIDHYETERVRKDGQTITISLTVSPILNADGHVIGASKIARDITEQRRQERARLASEERLRAVVEATPECVKIVAPDGSLEYMNHAGLCMIEAESETAVAGACVFDLVVPEHRNPWIRHHHAICAGERASWQFEIIGLKGTRRWMETHAVPLPRSDGLLGQLAVTREITAQKRMEAEREELLQSERFARMEAERASRLKDEFLATLSHELRTPLNAILGWSQILGMHKSSPEEVAEGAEVIARNARAQAQLIEDLLDMSRIMSGKVRLDVQAVDLASVVDAAVDAVRPAADAKEIRLRKILDPHAGPASGDPTRLQQVVWNLLNNAIKFTPKAGKVEVLLERVNSHLEITVHDSGIGIQPELLPVIFERFRQADSSTTRSHGGLGLGLSIVKSLVELHGGTVKAKSAGEGHGATFVVSLPLAPIRPPQEKREHPRTPTDPPAISTDVDLSEIKVLVVDDEADARNLVERLLEQCHATVLTAGSADEAAKQVPAFQPNVIVSDIGMPGTDGYQFMRRIRAMSADQGGRTPAIALTAFARSEDRTKAMMAGYTMHIAKPIEPQELIATVGNLVGRLKTQDGTSC